MTTPFDRPEHSLKEKSVIELCGKSYCREDQPPVPPRGQNLRKSAQSRCKESVKTKPFARPEHSPKEKSVIEIGGKTTGQKTSLATDAQGLSATVTAAFEVTATVPVNAAPVLSAIPAQSVTKGTAFAPISLNNYVTDETADANIVWTTAASAYFTVSIANNIATVTPKDASWTGSASIVFTATDAQGLSATITAAFEVTAPVDAEKPTSKPIPAVTVSQGSALPVVDLSKYFTDNSGSLTYSVASSAEIIASVSRSTLSMVAIDNEWTGTTAVLVTATDAAGNATSVSVAVTVSVKTADAMTANLSHCTLYPNPTSDIIIISNAEPMSEICITNRNGQVVTTMVIDNYVQTIDVSSLATGLYSVTVKKDGHTEMHTFVVQ